MKIVYTILYHDFSTVPYFNFSRHRILIYVRLLNSKVIFDSIRMDKISTSFCSINDVDVNEALLFVIP